MCLIFFCGYVVNKLKERELFLGWMNRNRLDPIYVCAKRIVAPGESKIPSPIKHFNKAECNSNNVVLNKVKTHPEIHITDLPFSC